MTSSYVQMDCIIKARVGNPREKLALIALASFANHEGTCWPSREALAARIECSMSSVRRILANLVRKGFIEIIHRANKSNVYRLVLSVLRPEVQNEQGGQNEHVDAVLTGQNEPVVNSDGSNWTGQNEQGGQIDPPGGSFGAKNVQIDPPGGSTLSREPDQRTRPKNQNNEPNQREGEPNQNDPHSLGALIADLKDFIRQELDKRLGALEERVDKIEQATQSLKAPLAVPEKPAQMDAQKAPKPVITPTAVPISQPAPVAAPRSSFDPMRKARDNTERSAVKALLDIGVEPETAADWLAMRQIANKWANTYVVKQFSEGLSKVREVAKDCSAQKAMEIWISCDWASFNVEGCLRHLGLLNKSNDKNQQATAQKATTEEDRNSQYVKEWFVLKTSGRWDELRALEEREEAERQAARAAREAAKSAPPIPTNPAAQPMARV